MRFGLSLVVGEFFVGEFTLRRRDTGVPQLTMEALRNLLEVNFNTLIFGVGPILAEENHDDASDN
jgi:hypothetical protein